MAVIDCAECAHKVSEAAPSCPSCGAPKSVMLGRSGIQTAASAKRGSWGGFFFMTLLAVGLICAAALAVLPVPSMNSFHWFILTVVFGLFGYFFPAAIASYRDHPQATAIFMLNVFLGWTVLGWVAALVWAFTTTKDSSSS